MTPEAKQALTLRLAGAKSSIKKLAKILQTVSSDHRLRDQYRYYGAHTGRWAGKGAQLQNLPRKKPVKAALEALENGGQVATLDDLSSCIRPIITAPKGKKVVLADFKSVENRVLMWASGCESGLQVYKDGKDPYIDFASRMEDIPYDEVSAELRQQAKAGVLGCGFGLGGGQLVRKCRCPNKGCKRVWNVSETQEWADCPGCHLRVKAGLVEKTGLWRYAEMMGIDLDQTDAHSQVAEFRTAFSEVASYWYFLEEAFAACAKTRRVQKVNSSLGCKLTFKYSQPSLRVVLPSGRELVYTNPFAFEERTPRGGKKITLGFESSRGKTWGVHNTYGGRICENIVQAIAADLLVDALLRTEPDSSFEIVGHTHDEIITLADEKDTGALDRLVGYMSVVEPWAEGLPMAADGYEGERYVKG